jgi:hypothetical protein
MRMSYGSVDLCQGYCMLFWAGLSALALFEWACFQPG